VNDSLSPTYSDLEPGGSEQRLQRFLTTVGRAVEAKHHRTTAYNNIMNPWFKTIPPNNPYNTAIKRKKHDFKYIWHSTTVR
jgi:hypothetical protein